MKKKRTVGFIDDLIDTHGSRNVGTNIDGSHLTLINIFTLDSVSNFFGLESGLARAVEGADAVLTDTSDADAVAEVALVDVYTLTADVMAIAKRTVANMASVYIGTQLVFFASR